PRRTQDWMATRAIRAAGSSWLRPRTQGVTIHTSCHAVSANSDGDKVRVQLNDGAKLEADHVLLGTGSKPSVTQIVFLSNQIKDNVCSARGYPVLTGGFESSVPGLYFVGATAAYSFGPLCRFVAGTRFAAVALTRSIKKKPARRLLATVP